MHIIIEGIDKVGKSTLALELAKRLYLPVINRLQPRENIFIECMDFFTYATEQRIVDRLHLSELAYGPVKRGKVRLDAKELDAVEKAALSLKTFNIYCSDDPEKIKQRFRDLNEDFTKEDEIEIILDNFEDALSRSLLDWHRYAIGDDIDELAEKIKKHFEANDWKTLYNSFLRNKN